MAFGDAMETFTRLTVGDGLVSQIPALIVSTAAGMLVTKGGVSGPMDKAVFGQLGRKLKSRHGVLPAGGLGNIARYSSLSF